ncbi:uncharacterized protein N7496_001284 [Penicillium cataractarum]|uniref:Uncharacterized protein n=1 Tax=Penicillium cataractarum TaxID=2100454 RepID=A0A9X0B6T5_9EURO|nr:uncharacterized protein N7496_001284 [Penicillium cataractarum]KAJ5390216.1 hypothetical protein N7496_001284 [Penicillium cataractarum]
MNLEVDCPKNSYIAEGGLMGAAGFGAEEVFQKMIRSYNWFEYFYEHGWGMAIGNAVGQLNTGTVGYFLNHGFYHD